MSSSVEAKLWLCLHWFRNFPVFLVQFWTPSSRFAMSSIWAHSSWKNIINIICSLANLCLPRFCFRLNCSLIYFLPGVACSPFKTADSICESTIILALRNDFFVCSGKKKWKQFRFGFINFQYGFRLSLSLSLEALSDGRLIIYHRQSPIRFPFHSSFYDPVKVCNQFLSGERVQTKGGLQKSRGWLREFSRP